MCIRDSPVGTLIALGCLLVVLALQSCMSSMVSVGNSTLAAIAASTYKAVCLLYTSRCV